MSWFASRSRRPRDRPEPDIEARARAQPVLGLFLGGEQVDEQRADRDAGAVERAIEEAIARSAEILALRHHAGELAQRRHQMIAAVLGF